MSEFLHGYLWGIGSVFGLLILLVIVAVWPRGDYGCDADGP
jgi:hypothetical protein